MHITRGTRFRWLVRRVVPNGDGTKTVHFGEADDLREAIKIVFGLCGLGPVRSPYLDA